MTLLVSGNRIQHALSSANAANDKYARQLERFRTRQGTEALERNDILAALPYFNEALKLASEDPAREDIHRARIGFIARYSPQLVHVWRHSGPIEQAGFSPGADFVVTASLDGTACVWKVGSGHQLLSLPHPQGHRVFRAILSPDGLRLLSASGTAGPDTLAMWDLGAQGKLIAKVGISTPVQFASFSPDGKRILVAGGRTAQIFDAVLRNGTLLNLERDDAIKQAQFSPDGKHLVVALFRAGVF